MFEPLLLCQANEMKDISSGKRRANEFTKVTIFLRFGSKIVPNL